MTTPPTFAIDFAAIEGRDSSPPQPSDKALELVGDGRDLQTVSFCSLLDAVQLQRAREIAAAQYPQMLRQRNELADYGEAVLDAVNACVNRMMAVQGKVRIPEVDHATREMNRAVHGFKAKYDPKDQRVQDMFDEVRRFLNGLFDQGRRLLVDLQHDMRDVAERLDAIAAKVVDGQEMLDRNVILCEALSEKNEESLVQLAGVIAILELIREEAATHAKRLQGQLAEMQETHPQRRKVQNELDDVTDFIGDLEMKLSEYIQRFFGGGAMAPMIRNVKKVSYSMSQRLRLLVRQTIPFLKMAVAVWGAMVQAQAQAAASDRIINAHNEALKLFAGASAEAIPKIMAASQRPSLDPATIMAVADSIVTQNEGLAEVAQVAQQQRALVVDAIVRANAAINLSGDRLNATVIELITQARKPLELPAAPEVPQAVLEHVPAA